MFIFLGFVLVASFFLAIALPATFTEVAGFVTALLLR